MERIKNMEKSKITQANETIARGVAEGYKKIETGVVRGYKRIEEGVVDGYQKIEDRFVERYLVHEGETVAQAKARLRRAQHGADSGEEAGEE